MQVEAGGGPGSTAATTGAGRGTSRGGEGENGGGAGAGTSSTMYGIGEKVSEASGRSEPGGPGDHDLVVNTSSQADGEQDATKAAQRAR